MSRKQDAILDIVKRTNNRLADIETKINSENGRQITLEVPCRVTAADVGETLSFDEGDVSFLRIRLLASVSSAPDALIDILRDGSRVATLTVRL